MKTYQIGNKVTCIIRAFAPSKIGKVEMQYENEPYTILKDVSVSISFSDTEKNALDGRRERQLNYDSSTINQVRISNVHLTNKVLNMLFNNYPNGLKSHYDSVQSDESGHIYLNTQEDTIYQVFIYNSDEEMIQAYGFINPNEIVLDADESYLVVYQTLSDKAMAMNSPNNTYYTLDLICEGNTDETTAPTYVHIHKCGIRSDKSLYFNNTINAVDFTFNVIATKDDYIVLE